MMQDDLLSSAGRQEMLPMLLACRVFTSNASGVKKSKYDFGMNRRSETARQQKRERSRWWYTK